jgi:hypothetical protein
LRSAPHFRAECRAVAASHPLTEKEENMSLSTKAMLACLLGSLLILPSMAVSTDSVPAKADPQTQKETEDKRKALMADATSAIQETQAALKTLDEGKTSQAIAALERATGKLDLILARDPKLELAPAGVSVTTYDVQGGLDAVKQVRKEAEELIEAGRLQEARRLIKNLASETVISVSNIPLATYPDAIKRAVKLIDEKKPDDAKRVLQAALNTQVVIDTVIPLPVVKAEEFLKTAEDLAQKKDRTKDDNDRLKTSFDRANEQLQFAQALGYGTKNDFDKMYQQLAEIRDKAADNQSGTGWFAKIKGSISELLKSSQSKKG